MSATQTFPLATSGKLFGYVSNFSQPFI